MNELTRPELKAIFDHEVFRKDHVYQVGDEVVYQGSIYRIRSFSIVSHLVLYDENLFRTTTATKTEVIFIPSIHPQLQEMSGLDWVYFCYDCGRIADSEGEYPHNKGINWLLSAAMVVLDGKAEWDGKEWV